MAEVREARSSIKVSGDRGYLRTGHQRMADIRSWTVAHRSDVLGNPANGVSTVTGRIESVDPFWSTYHPTSLWLWMGEVWWVWRKVEMRGSVEKGKTEFEVQGTPEVHV